MPGRKQRSGGAGHQSSSPSSGRGRKGVDVSIVVDADAIESPFVLPPTPQTDEPVLLRISSLPKEEEIIEQFQEEEHEEGDPHPSYHRIDSSSSSDSSSSDSSSSDPLEDLEMPGDNATSEEKLASAIGEGKQENEGEKEKEEEDDESGYYLCFCDDGTLPEGSATIECSNDECPIGLFHALCVHIDPSDMENHKQQYKRWMCEQCKEAISAAAAALRSTSPLPSPLVPEVEANKGQIFIPPIKSKIKPNGPYIAEPPTHANRGKFCFECGRLFCFCQGKRNDNPEDLSSPIDHTNPENFSPKTAGPFASSLPSSSSSSSSSSSWPGLASKRPASDISVDAGNEADTELATPTSEGASDVSTPGSAKHAKHRADQQLSSNAFSFSRNLGRRRRNAPPTALPQMLRSPRGIGPGYAKSGLPSPAFSPFDMSYTMSNTISKYRKYYAVPSPVSASSSLLSPASSGSTAAMPPPNIDPPLLRSRSEKKITCANRCYADKCGRVFKDQSSLDAHFLTSHVISCSDCNSVWVSQEALDKHYMEYHSGVQEGEQVIAIDHSEGDVVMEQPLP
jgi:hypothetical protein